MEEKKELTLKLKIGYGLGDMGGCMTFALMGSFFARYCLNILHVDAAVLAVLLAIWNIWDAVNDPMMGAIMDQMYARKHHPAGKFRPWILRSTPMLAVFAIGLWTVPTFLEGGALIVALFIFKILYEGAYTMFNIPMGSLLSAMADTDEERAQLSSARGFGAMLGNYIPMIMFPYILQRFGDSPTGYRIGIIICAVLGFFICLGHYYFTEERNQIIEEKTETQKVKATDILHVFRSNRAFLALCLHGVFICIAQAFIGNASSYMFGDVLGSIGLMSTGIMVGIPLAIISLTLAPILTKKFGLERLIRYCLLLAIAAYVGLYAAMTMAKIPPVVYMVWAGLGSMLYGVSVMMQWGLVGETIDYNEYLTDKRTEGSIYGTFNLMRRIGTTIGSSLAVLTLGWIGYDSNLKIQAASTLNGITAMTSLIPAIFIFGSWFAFKFVWNITPEIRERLLKFKETGVR